jgi:hypothetical protein
MVAAASIDCGRADLIGVAGGQWGEFGGLGFLEYRRAAMSLGRRRAAALF